MKYQEILENLCSYNPRNPNTCLDLDEPWQAPERCYCDNCFHGKTPLANALLEILDLGEILPRRPYLDSAPEGLQESDRDYLDNNRDLAVALLDHIQTFREGENSNGNS